MEADRSKSGNGALKDRRSLDNQPQTRARQAPSVSQQGAHGGANTREGTRMPREMARQFDYAESTPAHLDHLQIRVSQFERTVRVSLSGTLDCQGVEKMISLVMPQLLSRGCRIILDGSRLTHLDFRATHSMIRWNRRLREFNHQLYLKEWSDYLKAILVMEDWDRELGSTGSDPSAWRMLAGVATNSRP